MDIATLRMASAKQMIILSATAALHAWNSSIDSAVNHSTVTAQAQYRAALALEGLGRVDEAVQRAERALSAQSGASQGSGGQVSALVDRLRGLSVSGSKQGSRRGRTDRTSDTATANVKATASRDDNFLKAAAPKLASAPSAAASHGRYSLEDVRMLIIRTLPSFHLSPGRHLCCNAVGCSPWSSTGTRTSGLHCIPTGSIRPSQSPSPRTLGARWWRQPTSRRAQWSSRSSHTSACFPAHSATRQASCVFVSCMEFHLSHSVYEQQSAYPDRCRSWPQRCAACFRRLPMNPVFCQSCAAVAFCSAACRTDAAEPGGHAAGGPECGRPWSTLLDPDARLALRFIDKMVRHLFNRCSISPPSQGLPTARARTDCRRNGSKRDTSMAHCAIC